MDGIKARIRGRFSKRKSVSTPRDSTMGNSFDGATEQQQQQGRASLGQSQAAGASSQPAPDSVVETACNSQQPAHHCQPEHAASVTTASTGDSDGQTITTSPSTDRPRQSSHDAHPEAFPIGESHPGIALDR